MEQFSRMALLIGADGVDRLKSAKVAVYGLGGVGSFAVEALARAGIGHLVLVDFDEVCLSNLNRQLCALHSTLGRKKADVLRERIADINPQAQVTIYAEFITPENADSLLPADCDYLVDAVDNITAKLALIEKALALNIPIVSSMGAGNRLDPARLKIGDISETSIDPLAKVMRRELRKRGINKGVKVVYSEEPPLKPLYNTVDSSTDCISSGSETNSNKKRSVPGSVSFVPPVAGMFLASQVVRDLLGDELIRRKNLPEEHNLA